MTPTSVIVRGTACAARRVAVVLAILGACVSVPSLASAQDVKTNQPFAVEFSHDGQFTTGYRLFLDGSAVGADAPASARVNGVVTFQVPTGVAAGAHTIQAEAFGAGGATRSAVLKFTVSDPAPNEPGLPVIKVTTTAVATIRIQPDGQPIVLNIETATTANKVE